jgi:GST-like protein
MLDLYTWTTPNGRKVPILLAELDLPFNLHLVDLTKGEQHEAPYLAINPNGKIPALVDSDEPDGKPLTIFESGAILMYVCDKADAEGRFLPKDVAGRYRAIEWVMWQVGGIGPMYGQLGYFARTKPRNDAAFERFLTEGRRLTKVLDTELATREWLAGNYSIADIACYPWVQGMTEYVPEVLEGAPAVHRWLQRMGARPAVANGMSLGMNLGR